VNETPKNNQRNQNLRHVTVPLSDLFQRHKTFPSPLHEAMQSAARQAGWTAPWDHKENSGRQKELGKLSAIKRGLLREWRRTIVWEAYRRLPSCRVNPRAAQSIKALVDEYRKLVDEGCKGNRLAPRGDDFISYLPELLFALPQKDQQALKRARPGALEKDMLALGIRSKRKRQRSG
jgi:hypothetical protein